MIGRILLITLWATSGFAVQGHKADKVKLADLPDSICEIDYMAGPSVKRHCTVVFVSPDQVHYTPFCDPENYPTHQHYARQVACYPNDGTNNRVRVTYQIIESAQDQNFDGKKAKAGQRTMHNNGIIKVYGPYGADHPYMEPVTDQAEVARLLAEAPECRVVGVGGYANHISGISIPKQERQKLLQGDQIVMDHVQEQGELGAPFYCTAQDPKDPSKTKDYLIGIVNHSASGVDMFIKSRNKTYFSLMPEAAAFLKQQNVTGRSGTASAPMNKPPAAATAGPAVVK